MILHFNDTTMYFSFCICTVNDSRQIGVTTAVWAKIFLDATARIFSTVNRKPETLYMAPYQGRYFFVGLSHFLYIYIVT